MKRTFAFLLAAAMLLFAACTTKTQRQDSSCAKKIVGDWTIVSAKMDETGYDPETIGLGIDMSFRKDGTGVLQTTSGDAAEQTAFTYTTEGNEITIINQYEKTFTAVYDPAQKEIRMQISDSLSIVLEKTGDEPSLTAGGTQP